MHALSALSIKGQNLLLYSWQDDVPEFRWANIIVVCNIPEGITDLKISQVLSIFRENIAIGLAAMGYRNGCWCLVEEIIWDIRELVISTCVNLSYVSIACKDSCVDWCFKMLSQSNLSCFVLHAWVSFGDWEEGLLRLRSLAHHKPLSNFFHHFYQ